MGSRDIDLLNSVHQVSIDKTGICSIEGWQYFQEGDKIADNSMLYLIVPDVVVLILQVEDILQETTKTQNVYVFKVVESDQIFLRK